MIQNFVKGRTAVFIDASNVYFSMKSLKWKMDFKKLFDFFKKNTNLVHIFFYSSLNPENKQENRFHDFLDIIGYKVKSKKIKFIKDDKSGNGFHKANLDVDLTIDALHYRDSYNSFVLLSGDSDFEPLLKYLRIYSKKCIILSTKKHIAIELIRQAKFIDLKKLRSELEYKP
jgi:uncharacterized LabA/DUF88 family protein